MARVRLIHWNAGEGEAQAAQLRALGFDVLFAPPESPPPMRLFREDLPDAFVIDLTRLPAQGRELAVALRQSKSTRHIPIVFAGGQPEKVALIRAKLPDAGYAQWDAIAPAIRSAARRQAANPVVPPRLEGYVTASLPKKLGIQPGLSVGLIGAPDGFEVLVEAPDADIRNGLHGHPQVIILFVHSQEEMEMHLERAAAAMAPGGKLWVAYPKRAAGVSTNLTQATLREFGMAIGLVDFKVCSIDQTWTGFCFARRRSAKGRANRAGT